MIDSYQTNTLSDGDVKVYPTAASDSGSGPYVCVWICLPACFPSVCLFFCVYVSVFISRFICSTPATPLQPLSPCNEVPRTQKSRSPLPRPEVLLNLSQNAAVA